jgi:DNA-binding NtrC family response regulator
MPAPVIVIHDDTDTRELAVSALRAAGLEVVGFDDPMKVLNAIEADTRVRVLVSSVDFGPGKLNGVALARMLKVKRRDIEAVFVAPLADTVYADGVGEFLLSPIDPPSLFDTVARLLSRSGPGVGASSAERSSRRTTTSTTAA